MARGSTPIDLIAVGRSSVDLYGEQTGGRLEDMRSFAKYMGGSPTNTAAGGARLGLKTGLLTRVGDDHMGRFIRQQLTAEGVDVSGVISDPQRLTALVLLGIRDKATFPLIFYRENCADMALCEADVDAAWLASAGAVLINGTHLSKPGPFAASLKAAGIVKAGGGKVVLDIDYRPVLWGLTGKDAGENRFVADSAVTAQLQRALPLCDLIVGTEEEIHVLGGHTQTLRALKAIRRRTQALIVCKRGADGCVAFPGPIPAALEQGLAVEGFAVEVLNVLGAGDAFMAGFLRGWLRGEPLARCCQWANACGALVASRHGCAPAMPTWPELRAFLKNSDRLHQRRLEQTHWATTRRGAYDELTVLAIDHRNQLEEMAADAGVEAARIAAFKTLALEAMEKAAGGDERFGILLDGRHGFEALSRAADHHYWIGRPIERPKSRPLEFDCSADVATELATWPQNQVVKCLVFFHPDDERELRERQERQLLRLFDACRKTGHELLIEVIIPKGMNLEVTTVSRAIRRLYEIGIQPDWWKLEPVTDPAVWRNIDAAVGDNDPLCRGVLVLGLAATEKELIASFEVAAQFRIVKGFAVGRTIFQDAARDWFRGEIADRQVVDALAAKLLTLVLAWRRARAAGARAA